MWLQDIAGFDIGVEAEATGLLSYGSSLIYSISTNRTPMFTVLLRRCSGAGYYAMAGMPYDPVLQLATPISRLAVMEGRTLAIAAYNSKLDANFEIASTDPEERAAIAEGMEKTASQTEKDMDPVAAAARMDVDELVPPDEIREWLEVLVDASYQHTGYRRVKNPKGRSTTSRCWDDEDLDSDRFELHCVVSRDWGVDSGVPRGGDDLFGAAAWTNSSGWAVDRGACPGHGTHSGGRGVRCIHRGGVWRRSVLTWIR